MSQVTITDTAFTRINDLLIEEKNPDLKLRVFVQGGGCSGMEYGFTFDETQNDDDFTFEQNNVKVLVDAMSMQYLAGATINYIEDLQGARFAIDNPQAESTCGCGSSFSPN
jgi:iron-sulfur cluster insertion protein